MSVSERREEPAAGGAGRALGRRPRRRCGDHVERRRLRSSVPWVRRMCASGARRESLLLTYNNRAPSPTPQFLLLG